MYTLSSACKCCATRLSQNNFQWPLRECTSEVKWELPLCGVIATLCLLLAWLPKLNFSKCHSCTPLWIVFPLSPCHPHFQCAHSSTTFTPCKWWLSKKHDASEGGSYIKSISNWNSNSIYEMNWTQFTIQPRAPQRIFKSMWLSFLQVKWETKLNTRL